MTEYRVVERVAADRGERVHLARLDTSRSLCGHVTFDGSPFDDWQIVDEDKHPEDCDGANRCLSCWEAWEGAKRADRESRGEWNPPERTHVRAKPKRVSPQVRTQRIADRTRRPSHPRPDHELIRLYKAELVELGTPEAKAELARRAAKRQAKRAKVAA